MGKSFLERLFDTINFLEEKIKREQNITMEEYWMNTLYKNMETEQIKKHLKIWRMEDKSINKFRRLISEYITCIEKTKLPPDVSILKYIKERI